MTFVTYIPFLQLNPLPTNETDNVTSYAQVCGFHYYIHVVTVAVTGWLRPWSRSATRLTVYSSPGLKPVCTKEVMVLGSWAVMPPSLSWEKNRDKIERKRDCVCPSFQFILYTLSSSSHLLCPFSVEIRDVADKRLYSAWDRNSDSCS